jgi:hypothetical protein
MDEPELGEFITEQQRGVEVVRKGDSSVLSIIEWEASVEYHTLSFKLRSAVEDSGCSTAMDILVRGNLFELRDDRGWHNNLVLGESEREWVKVGISDDPERDERGGVGDKPGHLGVGDLVDEVLIQLLFQHAEVRRFFGANQCFEFFKRDLLIVVGGCDLLDECVIMGCFLKILAEGGHEDVCAILAKDSCERVSAINQAVGRPKLDALLIATHYVYVVSQYA